MKIIPLSEAKAHLSRYGRLCHDEPVIVTVNGATAFQLVPLGKMTISSIDSWSTILHFAACSNSGSTSGA